MELTSRSHDTSPALPLRQRLSQVLWLGLALLAGLHECMALAFARLRQRGS
jgi:hypothetical protein